MALARGGAGSGEIDFNAVASRPMTGVVEPKVCEWCGRQFFRSADGVYLDKYCAGCRAQLKRFAVNK